MSMGSLSSRIVVLCRSRSSPHSGNSSSWNEEEYYKELKEKATKAGYNRVIDYLDDLHKKDPVYLETSGRKYRECSAEHGAESPKCDFYKKYWLECKAVQNA